MMNGVPNFGSGLTADRRLGRYLRSNLYSNYLPGLEDVNQTFSALMSQPFTKQAGGGVNDMAADNQLTMQQYNPARNQLVQQNQQQKNIFADALAQTGSSRANMLSMLNSLLAMQQQYNTSGTAGLGGALGGIGQGFGL